MKKSMGFSLNELLEDADFAYDNDMNFAISKDSDELKELNIEDIRPNPYQPRKSFDEETIDELAASLKEHGLLQPIVVLGASELASALAMRGESLDTSGVKYFLIAGERRLRAAKKLGWSKIKSIIAAIEPTKTQELALIENIQRQDLNPIELALAYDSLMQTRGLTQEELAQMVQKSRSVIANTLRLLKLSAKTQELIASGKISAGHAKVIAGSLGHEDKVVNLIIQKNLSVRECEQLIDKLSKEKKPTKVEKEANPDILLLEESLLKTNLKHKINNSKLVFDLKDSETLQNLKNLFKNK